MRFDQALVALALLWASSTGAQEAPAPPSLAVDTVLVVLADVARTEVFLDGEPQGAAPLTLKGVARGPHTVTLVAPGLPPFHVELAVADGRTELNARVAVKRPAPDFAGKKERFDDAMFWIGLKGGSGLCACSAGAAALAAGVAMLFLPQTQATMAPAITAMAGASGCVGGASACGWSLLDMGEAPEEPIIQRVHVVKITTPNAGDSRLLELEAPAVDSDGEPLDKDDKDEEEPDGNEPSPTEQDPQQSVDVVYRY